MREGMIAMMLHREMARTKQEDLRRRAEATRRYLAARESLRPEPPRPVAAWRVALGTRLVGIGRRLLGPAAAQREPI